MVLKGGPLCRLTFGPIWAVLHNKLNKKMSCFRTDFLPECPPPPLPTSQGFPRLTPEQEQQQQQQQQGQRQGQGQEWGQEHSTAQSIPPSPGNWLQTERFEVAGQEVYREAGKPAGSRQAQCMFSACSVAAAYSAAYSAACSMQGMFSACSVCHSSSKFQQAVSNNAVSKQ